MLRVIDHAKLQGLAPNLAVYNVAISAAAGMGEVRGILNTFYEFPVLLERNCVAFVTRND